MLSNIHGILIAEKYAASVETINPLIIKADENKGAPFRADE